MTTSHLHPGIRDNWSTPMDLFRELDHRFGFELDVCAQLENAKCRHWFTPEIDGLSQDWAPAVCFMNPPYGPPIATWLRKAVSEWRRGATVVALLPARTDTIWFHELVLGVGAEVEFLKGRLRFDGSAGRAPFASMVVIYR